MTTWRFIVIGAARLSVPPYMTSSSTAKVEGLSGAAFGLSGANIAQ